jgi:hypothetical protein
MSMSEAIPTQQDMIFIPKRAINVAVCLKIQVLLNVTACGFSCRYICYSEPSCFHLQSNPRRLPGISYNLIPI